MDSSELGTRFVSPPGDSNKANPTASVAGTHGWTCSDPKEKPRGSVCNCCPLYCLMHMARLVTAGQCVKRLSCDWLNAHSWHWFYFHPGSITPRVQKLPAENRREKNGHHQVGFWSRLYLHVKAKRTINCVSNDSSFF